MRSSSEPIMPASIFWRRGRSAPSRLRAAPGRRTRRQPHNDPRGARRFQRARTDRVNGREKIIRRRPVAADYYPEIETEPVSDLVEKRFMQWILHGDCKPGQQINSLELARQFGVSTSAIREYLNGFRHSACSSAGRAAAGSSRASPRNSRSNCRRCANCSNCVRCKNSSNFPTATPSGARSKASIAITFC